MPPGGALPSLALVGLCPSRETNVTAIDSRRTATRAYMLSNACIAWIVPVAESLMGKGVGTLYVIKGVRARPTELRGTHFRYQGADDDPVWGVRQGEPSPRQTSTLQQRRERHRPGIAAQPRLQRCRTLCL